MYSVIIPTMWKSDRTFKLLNDLNSCNSVGEIILINNVLDIPKELKDNDKLKILQMEKNQYVNPSWNLGVQYSKYENVALCNDDINFNCDVFNHIKISENTLIGLHSSCFGLDTDMNLNFIQTKNRCNGFGCLMFLSKKNYIPIPNEMKVAYGDDYLIDIYQNVYQLLGLSVKTEMSTTSKDSEFTKISDENDRIVYLKWKNKL